MTEDFDLEAILAPIGNGAPAGTDLRQDYSPTSIYFRIRDARAEARDAERQAEAISGDETVAPQWRTVQALSLEALATGAKDLEVAAWLTEALVRTAGLRGLATGAAIIAGLVERYWDELFPMPDEDGMETRVAALGGLSGQSVDGTLMQPLRKVTLFQRPDGKPFGLWEYEATLDLARIVDAARRAARIEAGVVPFDDVEKEARRADPKHWAAIRADVARAQAAWAAMGRTLDAKAGADSPSIGRVRDLLQLLAETADRFAPAPPATAEPAQAAGGAALTVPGMPDGGSKTMVGSLSVAIAGREQALRQLEEVAAWFRRTEPHSPLSYTLDDAVRRGRMTLPELLLEIMPDESARSALLTTLGIRPQAPDQE